MQRYNLRALKVALAVWHMLKNVKGNGRSIARLASVVSAGGNAVRPSVAHVPYLLIQQTDDVRYSENKQKYHSTVWCHPSTVDKAGRQMPH